MARRAGSRTVGGAADVVTPDQIANSKRKSGYNHVTNDGGVKPYRASSGRKWLKPHETEYVFWRGPRRATALEAAQDYCDYVNSSPISPSVPVGRAGVKRARHTYTAEIPEIPSDIEAAYGMIRDYKAQLSGKVDGYVYLIIEENVGGGLTYGKIGYSTNPRKRVAELQTGNPRPLKLYAAKLGTLDDEAALHRRHIDKNILQEWFHLDAELLLEWSTDEIVYGKEDSA